MARIKVVRISDSGRTIEETMAAGEYDLTNWSQGMVDAGYDQGFDDGYDRHRRDFQEGALLGGLVVAAVIPVGLFVINKTVEFGKQKYKKFKEKKSAN